MMKVCAHPCDQCLFSDNKVVSEERKAELIATCIEKDIHFICHKGTIAGGEFQDLVCYGFYIRYSTYKLRLFFKFNMIEFLKPHDLVGI